MHERVCVRARALHFTWTANSNLPNELMTVIVFNNLLDRSDIYLFLYLNIKNMKEASLNVLNIAITV